GLAEEAGSANERLVRHYVQIGVITAPEREGRESVFRVRQIAEFLSARRLLSEGWPLAKIGELLKDIHLVEDTTLHVAEPSSMFAPRATSAERALEGIRSREPHKGGGKKPAPREGPSAYSPSASSKDSSTSQTSYSLGVATQIAQRRGTLRDSLIAMGNTTGTAERHRIVRISLTSWCHVDIDADRLGQLSDTDPELLGTALTSALREERLRKGH